MTPFIHDFLLAGGIAGAALVGAHLAVAVLRRLFAPSLQHAPFVVRQYRCPYHGEDEFTGGYRDDPSQAHCDYVLRVEARYTGTFKPMCPKHKCKLVPR